MAVAYVPLYLFTVLLWAPWLAVLLLRRTGAAHRAAQTSAVGGG